MPSRRPPEPNDPVMADAEVAAAEIIRKAHQRSPERGALAEAMMASALEQLRERRRQNRDQR